MSICKGIAGARGKNPVGIFIHNDAGSQRANMAHYKNWLPTHNLSNGFAHYYVAEDGVLQAEDDSNRAWHCGNPNGNNNYLSIEVCQSMGNLETVKANEERALKLAADKCKQYNIVPSDSTIMLHQEVYATACPHRSVEIHGGRAGCKAYFIERIKVLMASNTSSTNNNSVTTETNNTTNEEVVTMHCFFTVDGKGPVIYLMGLISTPCLILMR